MTQAWQVRIDELENEVKVLRRDNKLLLKIGDIAAQEADEAGCSGDMLLALDAYVDRDEEDTK